MKITKAKLKQIIKEELSALKEAGDAFSHHATKADPRGTSAPLTTDAPGMAGVGDADSAVKNLKQAELLISQAVDFFKQEGRIDQGVLQSLESMAADLRRY